MGQSDVENSTQKMQSSLPLAVALSGDKTPSIIYCSANGMMMGGRGEGSRPVKFRPTFC